MTIRTRVCDILEIDYPIVLAGMGGASTPEGEPDAAGEANTMRRAAPGGVSG